MVDDILAAIQELRAYVDTRIGDVMNAVDDLRASFGAHDRNQQELVTQVDAALRELVNEVDAKVVAVQGRVGDVETGVRSLGTGLDNATTAMDQFAVSHAALQARLTEIVGKQDDLATRVEVVNTKVSERQSD